MNTNLIPEVMMMFLGNVWFVFKALMTSFWGVAIIAIYLSRRVRVVGSYIADTVRLINNNKARWKSDAALRARKRREWFSVDCFILWMGLKKGIRAIFVITLIGAVGLTIVNVIV